MNWANRCGSSGIPIWNTEENAPVEGSKIYWEESKSNWEKMALTSLKTAFEALRAGDSFWTGENSTLRENPNELKIMERASGDVLVQIVVDDSTSPPTQEIYTHFGAEKVLNQNWKQA